MPLGTEFQPIGKDWLGSNDKSARDSVGTVVSRGAFGLNTVSVTATGSLDYHYSTFLVDTTAGALTLTLPFANTLSTSSGSTGYLATKAMVMYLMMVAGTNNCTISPQAGDTINGLTSLTLVPGDRYELISDGGTKWYALSATYAQGNGTALEWTPVLTFTTPGNLVVAYGSQVADYTRVGRLVIATFRINTTTFTYTTATGNLTITGLPFTAANVTNAIWAGSVVWGGITKAGYGSVIPQVTANTSFITFVASGTGVAAANITTTEAPTASTIVLRGFVIYHI